MVDLPAPVNLAMDDSFLVSLDAPAPAAAMGDILNRKRVEADARGKGRRERAAQDMKDEVGG